MPTKARPTSEPLSELGVLLQRQPTNFDMNHQTIMFPGSNNATGTGAYDSFLDVGAADKGRSRSRKETLKATKTLKKDKKDKIANDVATNSNEDNVESNKSSGGRLRKKASKLFRSDKRKSNSSDTKRPVLISTGSSTVSNISNVSESRPADLSSERRDSSTTLSSEFSLTSNNEQHIASSTPSSGLSLSPPSRRSSAASGRSFFRSRRRSSSNRKESSGSSAPSAFKRRGSSNSQLTSSVSLGPVVSASTSLPPHRAFRLDSIHASDRGDDSSFMQIPEIPSLITTSATPGPIRQESYGSNRSDQQQGLGGRMSNWFANIMPTNVSLTGNGGTALGERRSQDSVRPVRPVRPESLLSAKSGPLPTSVSAPARTSFSSIPSDSQASSSPKGKVSSTSFLQAARQKAAGMGRWVLDSEAAPDGLNSIWVLGVEHRFDNSTDLLAADTDASTSEEGSWGKRQSGKTTSGGSPTGKRLGFKRNGSPSPSNPNDKTNNYFNSKTGMAINNMNLTGSPGKRSKASSGDGDSPGRGMRSFLNMGSGKDNKSPSEASLWPESFIKDYRSIIWCTYRSQYAPIVSITEEIFMPSARAYLRAQLPPLPQPQAATTITSSSPSNGNGKSSWSWVATVGAGIGLASAGANEKGLTSDAGWGCMLRTGQSLLANSLIRRHLGRDWRTASVPAYESRSTQPIKDMRDLASYTQIVSWFMDDPSPICPFSVHRMALVGKQLGKEVGEWFGPSTAAGAIKTLTNAFPACGIAVSAATDGIIFRSDVFTASNGEDGDWSKVVDSLPWSETPRRPQGGFGGKGVLVLVNVRLGTNNVNPIYYDSLKALFTAPQTVGISGGRPSSSYYFVGYQGDSLFYLDPHFTRSAVPLHTPPSQRTVDTSGAIPIVNAKGREIDPDELPLNQSREENITWLASAYEPEQLATFHCDRVRKMPMSSLDPSMLLGFLIQDENDWQDFVERMNNVRHKIFSIQEQPTFWNDDEDGMESLSEDGFSAPSIRNERNSTKTGMTEEMDDIISRHRDSLTSTDDESDMVPSVPHTPTRRRLRPSATESTLNARAMMDEPFILPSSVQLPTGLDSSPIVLTSYETTEEGPYDDEFGVLVEPTDASAPHTEVNDTPADETIRRAA